LISSLQNQAGKGQTRYCVRQCWVAKFAAFGTITEELYDWTFDINVKGLLFTVQKACPPAGWRSIILIHPSSEAKGYQSIGLQRHQSRHFVRSRGRGQPT